MIVEYYGGPNDGATLDITGDLPARIALNDGRNPPSIYHRRTRPRMRLYIPFLWSRTRVIYVYEGLIDEFRR